MAAPHSTRIEELLPAYALGALDGEDLRELEAHLDVGCAECRRQLDLWNRDLEKLAASVPPLPPAETTRARILRLAAGAAPASPRVPRWMFFAAAALLLLSVWGAAERVRLAREVEALEHEVDLARAEARQATEALQILAAPSVRSVVLAGLGPSPEATGHTYVNPQTRDALFYAFNLPRLGQDKTYQLWFIAGGKPVSAGTFAVDERGTGRLRVEKVVDVKDIQAWAVTIEPRGGVPQPTGEMVLKG